VFSFGDDPAVGGIVAISPTENGDLLALSYVDQKPTILRCNFRGEAVGRVALSGVPAEHAEFRPGTLRYAAGKIYLADLAAMEVLVADASGRFDRFFDLAPLLEIADRRQDFGMRGFNVDREGNVLFTVQPLFKAYVLSPAGALRAFGQRGGGPGKFNIVAGIAADEHGNIYVTDILKSAVLVFDRDLNFVREFGARGDDGDSIVAPVHVAAGNDKVFVSQYARRGVSVFKVQDD
jgi:hypothetical protein